MNNNILIHKSLSQFSIERKIFQIKVVDKIETHILCSIMSASSPKSHLCDNVEKRRRVGQATDDNMVHVHCMLDN